MLYYIFIHLSCASSCNSDMRESIYSYMKKDSFPNEKTWVISICQSALGLRPQGLTHIGKLFIVVGQCKQERTISQADSRGIWNWYLNAIVFWWWSEWEAWVPGSSPCGSRVIRSGDGVGNQIRLFIYRYKERLGKNSVVGKIEEERGCIPWCT